MVNEQFTPTFRVEEQASQRLKNSPFLWFLRKLFPILGGIWGLHCGGTPPEMTIDCLIHETPSFELGTGESQFEALEEGQDLSMVSGPQGGCHFWLAVRSDGFADRLFDIQYDIRFANTGTTTGSRYSQKVRLTPTSAKDGRCEFYGYTAFLVRPWLLEDRELDIRVTVVDDLGRSEEVRRKVTGRWPAAVPGVPRDDLCGRRN